MYVKTTAETAYAQNIWREETLEETLFSRLSLTWTDGKGVKHPTPNEIRSVREVTVMDTAASANVSLILSLNNLSLSIYRNPLSHTVFPLERE